MSLTVGELRACLAHAPDNMEVVVEAGGLVVAAPIKVAASGVGLALGEDGTHVAVVRVEVGPNLGRLFQALPEGWRR